jgi:hypothetical protein
MAACPNLPAADRARSEGEEMISWRLAVSAVLVAAILAGCFAYFVTPPLLPRVELDQRLPPAAPDLKGPDPAGPTNSDQRRRADERAAAFHKAAAAILRRAQYAQASAGTDEPPITGHIPLPKRRPIPRP